MNVISIGSSDDEAATVVLTRTELSMIVLGVSEALDLLGELHPREFEI